MTSLSSSLNKENIDFIKIHGHTDLIGDPDYNMKLSLNRANAIKDYLSSQNLSIYITEIQGYGDRYPLESNLSERGRQKNRRVEVIIKHNKIDR